MTSEITASPRIAVVIPCYRVRNHIAGVLAAIPTYVTDIYVVDDACPEHTADYVRSLPDLSRVHVLQHQDNQGVGGAVCTGYARALADGADVVVKLDGDGQMDPALIERFVRPILDGKCDYTKGNRFYYLDDLRAMPRLRLFGNAILSFMTKLSSGYWTLFDPTNGYTAIHARVIANLPLEKLSRRYFFESDILFRLNIIRAVVDDIPMRAIYGDEKSGLKINRIIMPFLAGHLRNFGKRVFYSYFLRDFSVASIELLLGLPLIVYGLCFGLHHWATSIETGVAASAGTVMLSALPILVGVQFVLSFLNFDIQAMPRSPLHPKLGADHHGKNN